MDIGVEVSTRHQRGNEASNTNLEPAKLAFFAKKNTASASLLIEMVKVQVQHEVNEVIFPLEWTDCQRADHNEGFVLDDEGQEVYFGVCIGRSAENIHARRLIKLDEADGQTVFGVNQAHIAANLISDESELQNVITELIQHYVLSKPSVFTAIQKPEHGERLFLE